MAIICPQCMGKGASNQVSNPLQDIQSNTDYPLQDAQPCTQCGGKGYQQTS